MSNKTKRLCNENCNNCPIVAHENSKILTKIFNECHKKFGDDFYSIIQKNCSNLTVCYDCRIDDFCHIEGCKLINN